MSLFRFLFKIEYHNNPFKLSKFEITMADKRVKMAIIAGASKALKYKEKNPHASEAQVLEVIHREIDSIANKID